MKIVRITTFLDFGGQERQYMSLSEIEKSELKNEYIFAAIGHGGYAERKILSNGFQVKIFNKNPNIFNLANVMMLYKWFKDINPDLVHTAAAEANFHGIIAARLAGVKFIIAEEIGFPNHSYKAKIIFKFLYKFTSKVICVSKSVKDFLISIDEIDSRKGVVIYNPVSKINPVDRKLSKQFTIINVGRFEKVKNQQLLIKAFSKLDDKQSKLILVGDGRERELLEKLIVDLDLKERVILTGFIPDVEKYLAKSHLFVLPSIAEGFGIAVVEAMQQGVACLCTCVGGIPEFIMNDETGWLFNPNNQNEMVDRLNYIINLPLERINEIGENGKKFVSNKFTTKNYIENLEILYQSLV